MDRITQRLVKKVYKKDYNDYVQDDEQPAADFAKEIRDKKVYYDMCKTANTPNTLFSYKQNHFLKYYNKCLKEGVVSLPVLFKVRDKGLTLKGYALNMGNCKSIKESITHYPDIMDSVNLTNNSVKDEELAVFLKGLLHLKELKKIIIKDNEF